MAINTRNCFWFGTEERADWFATPLQGADSSPSAWGADGTLLNGGGWALNSWGSHKRYTYEWPASSSRETAQRMKSYRDGTYGRGLLYFLEPTIFTTNVLPAHWADPSMSLDNEAPSLVYGVDPTPVATSGGANLGLPITSAHYDLSTVTSQTIPTPDTSVFIPIPTGHTLFLGAFYSSTGAGGVYVTPVNGNGTLGTAVKLTEKSNSDTSVVTDQFSGDLRGVRIWVGRTDSTASTVTLAAMVGRLLETSDVPSFGPWVENRRNLFLEPRPQTAAMFPVSSLDSAAFVGTGVNQAREAYSTGAALGRINLEAVSNRIAVTPGDSISYSIETQGTSGVNRWLRLYFRTSGGTVVGSFIESSVATTTDYVTQTVSGVVPDGAVWAGVWVTFDSTVAGRVIRARKVMVERTVSPGGYFDGGTNPTGELERTRWVSAVNGSESVLETRVQSGSPARVENLSRGPWMGGQGHSGCRFLGTPSYVTNSPIEGGRIGFAASFVEVGSWVYG